MPAGAIRIGNPQGGAARGRTRVCGEQAGAMSFALEGGIPFGNAAGELRSGGYPAAYVVMCRPSSVVKVAVQQLDPVGFDNGKDNVVYEAWPLLCMLSRTLGEHRGP